MVRQHHQLNAHESEQNLGDSEGQGAWHAAVHELQRFEQDLATEQQTHSKNKLCWPPFQTCYMNLSRTSVFYTFQQLSYFAPVFNKL